MKIWVKTEEFSEGKFLVVRRDGTTPDWSHFVLGARDPAAPAGLRAYADETEARRFDPDYVASVRELSIDFQQERQLRGNGDPDASPHRKDQPLVIAMMRHELDMADIIAALQRIELAGARGEGARAAAIACMLINGRKPKPAE